MSKLSNSLLAIVFIAGSLRAQVPFIEKKDNQLKKINEVIRARWKDEVSTSKDFPFSYITAFAQDPHMFYWDTYFINKGLIATGNLQLAKQNTLNLLSVVSRYGFMGNAAVTTWGMNRSQPPYLSVMVRDIYEAEKSKKNLRNVYHLLKQEYDFWTDTTSTAIENHKTDIAGLQRYFHHASTSELISLYDEIADRLGLQKNLPDGQKSKIASDYAAEAETGMDFTSRFENKCSQFVALDLNCLLYLMEKNLDWMCRELKLKNEPDWAGIAFERAGLINKYCWDEKTGMYYDFNFVEGRRSRVAAVTTFQPLWAGIASAQQARRVSENLAVFATPYGLKTTIKEKERENYQWGSNSVWAPMQLIAAEGLKRYGYVDKANEIALNFMGLVAKNYIAPLSSNTTQQPKRPPGLIYEKYKANGTINDDETAARPMMGWTAGVFAYLYQMLNRP